MGVWVLPNANSLDVIGACARRSTPIKRELPTGMQVAVAFDSTDYINNAIDEVDAHARRDGAHRHRGHLPVPRLAAHGAGAAGRDPGVAHRRRVPDAGVRLHAEPADAARDRARRSASWSTTRSSWSRTSSATSARARRRSRRRSLGARELVGPIIAMTITLAAVYAPIGFQGGLTGALFREFAFTLAGAVFISGVVALTLSPMMSSRLLQRRAPARLVRAQDRARVRRACKRALRARARRRRCASRPARLRGLDRARAAARADVHVLAERARAATRTRASSSAPSTCRRTRRSSSCTPYTDAGQQDRSRPTPEFDHSFQITLPDRRLRRHAREAVGRAQAQHLPDPGRARAASSARITGIRAPVFLPPALPSAGLFPVEFVIASTASHEEILRFAEQLVARRR